jgi:glycosyltransferase involved in cell wall biosynthesis
VFISGPRGVEDVAAYVQRAGYDNVFFHPAIPRDEVVDRLAECDVGVVPTWNPGRLSYWLALDNKIFDYLMAGIPVLATRQPEYLRLVDEHGIGVCVDPEDEPGFWGGYLSLMGDYEAFVGKARAARRVLNWEREREGLIELYRRIERERVN